MRIRRIVFLTIAALGLSAGIALGTPGSGAVGSDPVRGTIGAPFKVEVDGLIEVKTNAPIDVVDQTITIAPGGHTGWHSHPGPVLVVIESGTFTFYDGDDPDCDPQVFSAGDAFVDRGGGHVHIGRNESGAPVELSVTYLLPQGAGPRTDAPDPGNCDF